MLRLDKTKPHATITNGWQGAFYKQGAHYFDAAGELVVTPNSPAADADRVAGRPVDPESEPGAKVSFKEDGRVAIVDGVRYIREDDVAAHVEKALADAKVGEPPLPAPKKSRLKPEDIEEINGIGPVAATKLRAMGITTIRDVANIQPEAVELIESDMNRAGMVDRERWREQAVVLLAELNPEAVRETSSPPPVEPNRTGLSREDLRAWGLRQKNFPFAAVRTAIRDLLSVAVTKEVDAGTALDKAGILPASEFARGGE